ncbi:MAG: hypothetical protein ACXWCF_07800 [Kaistella sp.]
MNRFIVLESQKDLYGFVDMENNFFRVEPSYTDLDRPKEMKYEMGKKTRYLFLFSRNGQSFYVDNLGKEFISK